MRINDEDQLPTFAVIASVRPVASAADTGLAQVIADLEALKTDPSLDAPLSFPRVEIVSLDATTIAGSVSQIVQTGTRRGTRPSRAIDRRNLKHFKAFEQAQERAAERAAESRASVGSSTPPAPTPLSPSQQADAKTYLNLVKDRLKANGEQAGIKRRRARENPAWVTPRTWAKTTEQVQAVFWHRVIRDRGGVAFVVNFTPDVLDRANKASIGAPQFMRRRITKALKDALGRDVDLWCALDTTKDGRLHLHGGVAINDNEIAVAELALRKASGLGALRRVAPRQVWFGGVFWELKAGERFPAREDRLQDDWAGYSVKNVAELEKQTGHSCVYTSQSIKNEAETNYRDLRKSMIVSKS